VPDRRCGRIPVYPFCDTRPIQALTDWLDASSIRSFPAMLLDMYPKGRVDQAALREGQDPIEITGLVRPGNYTIKRNTATATSGSRAGRGRGLLRRRPRTGALR
jgi:hypothetical protein